MVTPVNASKKIKQNKSFSNEISHAQILVFMQHNVKSAKTFLLDKLKMHFPQDGLAIEEFGTVTQLKISILLM